MKTLRIQCGFSLISVYIKLLLLLMSALSDEFERESLCKQVIPIVFADGRSHVQKGELPCILLRPIL